MTDFRRGLTDYLERMLRAQERIAAEWEGYLPGVREAADRAEEREDKVRTEVLEWSEGVLVGRIDASFSRN